VVVVATLRALKHHGGVDAKDLNTPNLAALEKGMANLERHVDNIRNRYGLPCVVSINHFTSDTEPELDLLRQKMDQQGVPVVVARHWSQGSAGAEDLARIVVKLAESGTAKMRFVYEDADTLWDKMKAIATQVYGAADISADSAVRAKIDKLQQDGYGHYPVCVAKTQYSFSTDPKLRAAPSGHTVNVREVRLAAGAEVVVMICGDIMTMPGLPKEPASMRKLHAGTPSYINPEQWGLDARVDGKRSMGSITVAVEELSDSKSDLYALGVTLYQILTSKLPYGEVLPYQAGRYYRDPTPLSRHNPAIPMWLEHVVLKAVARDKRQRFETAEEFLLALERGASRPLTAPQATSLLTRDPTAAWKLGLGISLLFNLMLVYWLLFLPT
jgi:hypothetical protein